MPEILKSMTKIVFLLMTIAFIVLTFVGKIDGKDFVNAMMIIITFYFGQKGMFKDPTVDRN